jgi:hypothetical protein
MTPLGPLPRRGTGMRLPGRPLRRETRMTALGRLCLSGARA